MIWVYTVRTDPPEWMRHDPTIQDKYGRNLAMFWIKYIKTEPPEWM